MDFAFDALTEDFRGRLLDFMDSHVYPAEEVFEEQYAATQALPESDPAHWAFLPVIEDLKAEAKARGLWNLFLPGEHGAGLTNLQYAPLAEILGRSPHLGPVATNCAAPDTGNMEVLTMFGTPEQKQRWLEPLLAGEIRSGFSMTEPAVASSDATNIGTSIVRDGDEYVINGDKWWTTGAMNPNCAIFIVMGKTDPSADRHRQQSMILVPRETSGVSVRKGLKVYGFDDAEHGGHALIEYRDVRVPASNLIGAEGDGFAIAQARLGPGRIHHCMRAIGLAERAVELMCARAESRVAFGAPLADRGVVREWIALSRVKIEQARLLVLKTAWLMDTVGNKGAHAEIQAIKIAVPREVEWIMDKAIQLHGAAGVSQETPLADWMSKVRTLRIVDGPDEVHLRSLGKREITRQAKARAARG